MRIIETIDFLLLPFFLLSIFFVAHCIRILKYKQSPLGEYFMRGISFRIIGAILTALMYQYYYGYGDTMFYYVGARDIANAFYRSPVLCLEMLFSDYADWSRAIRSELTLHVPFLDESSALVSKIAGGIGIFTFGSYFGMSLGITTIAFLGCWRLYKVFYDLYPHLHRPLAWAILYIPSVCFWGTGLMKDPLTLAGLGFFVHGVYWIFIRRKRILISVFWLYLGAYLIVSIKVYIFLSIAPACLIWVLLTYHARIKSRTIYFAAVPVFLIIGTIGVAVVLQQIGETFQRYALQNILDQAYKTQHWIAYSTQRDLGTGYTLGEFDASLGGLLKTFPLAVNATLFRPYIWEARKLIILPSAFEAIVTLFLTFYVFFKVGASHFMKYLLHPSILFCMTFALLFAFAVGFTAMNFGALARYKIPCLPFYFAGLVLIFYAKFPISQRLLQYRIR